MSGWFEICYGVYEGGYKRGYKAVCKWRWLPTGIFATCRRIAAYGTTAPPVLWGWWGWGGEVGVVRWGGSGWW